MYKYQVLVKVKGSTVKTIIFADNEIHARLLAQYQYGMNSLLSNLQKLGLSEAGTIKPLTPDQLKIKSMQDRVKKDQQAIKVEKVRQKIKTSQNQLMRLNNPPSNNLN